MKELKGMKIELPEGYELKQEGETYKVVKKEFKLKKGKDYRSVVDEAIVIDREGYDCNFGFLDNEFTKPLWCSCPESWREATKEEVIEAFEEECVRVFGENWKDVEIEECMYHSNSEYLNTGIFVVNISKDNEGWKVWNKNGCLYFKGNWAKKKEGVKYAEKLEDIERAYYISSSGEINRSISSQDVNNLPTEKLAEGVLALIQLLSFRQDIWDKGGKPEGDESFGVFQYDKENISVTKFYGAYGGEIFRFKTREQAEYFKETHEGLLKEYYDKCGII